MHLCRYLVRWRRREAATTQKHILEKEKTSFAPNAVVVHRSTQNAFSILLPFLPTKSPTNMCIFSTDVLRFLKNETYFYLQAKKKVGEIPLTFFLQLCFARFARALSRLYHYSTCWFMVIKSSCSLQQRWTFIPVDVNLWSKLGMPGLRKSWPPPFFHHQNAKLFF